MRETLSSALCLFQANPALLHVFVCLRMSLVTALSSIATVSLSDYCFALPPLIVLNLHRKFLVAEL